MLQANYGVFVGKAFLVGFWAAAFSSTGHRRVERYLPMFADFMGRSRGLPDGHPDTRVGGKYFKSYLIWLTFPPMVLLFLGSPISA